jgi:hypothetical protein
LEYFPKILPLTLKLIPEAERSAVAGEMARAMLDVSQAWP